MERKTTMSGGRKPAGAGDEETEVGTLLQAAQDAVLLKLQVNSHLVSSFSTASNPASLGPAPDSLNADLARCFDTLRSHPPAPKRPDATSVAVGADGMEELDTRFTVLKGGAMGPEKETRVELEGLGGELKDDEVEKVMQWAMDAARLNMTTARSDNAKHTEEKDERSSVSSEDKEDRMELEMERKRKEMAKNKWFFFRSHGYAKLMFPSNMWK